MTSAPTSPFPDGFGWGTTTSSDRTMGPADGSDLGAWEADGRRAPSAFDGASAAGFAADIEVFAAHGLRQLRIVLDWARLEPTAGTHSSEAIEVARQMLTDARDAGLSPWACLHDGSLPGWFSIDERGFSEERSWRYYWSRHVEFVGEVFGDLVDGWVPVVDPVRWARRGWLVGDRPPGRVDDVEGFASSLEGLLLANVDAARRLREGGRPTASAFGVVPVFAARHEPDLAPSADAEAMRTVADEVLNGCWIRMLHQATLVVGQRAPIVVEAARDAFDVIGFSYRHAVAARGDGALLAYPQQMPRAEDGSVAWAEGFTLALHHVAEELPGRPIAVTGFGASTPDEDLRVDYVRDVLQSCAEGLAGGIDLRGLWWEDPVDVPGSGRHPGLFTGDRRPRPAADLLASVAAGGPIPS